MIEAKMKDSALFQLAEDLRTKHSLKFIDQSSFEI
jgi:UV DNA damage endonuclease